MSDVAKMIPAEVAGYRTANLQWKRLLGTPKFDYPIDYAIAVLGIDETEQRVDFLTSWEPGAYCHYHQHLGPTSSVVIAGELHVVETEENLHIHKTRKPGHSTGNDGGDMHMEYAGPEGAVAFFSMKPRADGKMFDVLANNRRVLRTVTFEEFAAGDY